MGKRGQWTREEIKEGRKLLRRYWMYRLKGGKMKYEMWWKEFVLGPVWRSNPHYKRALAAAVRDLKQNGGVK